VLRLIGNTFCLASRNYWDATARDLRPVYTHRPSSAPESGFGEFHAT
jgi:hypothetical protein